MGLEIRFDPDCGCLLRSRAVALEVCREEAAKSMDVPRCTRYDVALTIRPERVSSVFKLYGGSIAVDCTATIENHAAQALNAVPFLLYRLLCVDRVEDGIGQALPFTQWVVALEEKPRWQVNAVAVSLPAPLAPGDSCRVRLCYHGPICGYSEVMAYVQDHVSERYTLLRWEALWYPLVGHPVDAAPPDAFHFDLSVTVPPGDLVVVSNGRVRAREARADGVCYRWQSIRPVKWGRMTVACAPFQQIAVSPGVSLYCLAGEEGGEQAVAQAMRRACELGTAWFGPLPTQELSIVEVPDGLGAEAADHLILLTSEAFQGYRSSLNTLGHELIHLWNAPSREAHVSRFLDEGITHYVQALLLREEFGEDAYWELMRQYRSYFGSRGEGAYSIPLAEAGLHGPFTEPISRGKGPWVLCVLHRLLGDRLIPVLRTFFDRYRAEGATLADFEAEIGESAAMDLSFFFQEWFWGTASSALLAREVDEKDLAEQLARRYEP
jgi:hypothetical protein